MALHVAPFRRAGLDLSLADLERLVMEAATTVLPTQPAVDARGEMTEAEAAFLRDAGVDLGEFAPHGGGGVSSALARTAAEYASILAASLTVAELAARLEVDESSVRQRLAAHRLFGMKDGRRGWRVPLFELDDERRKLVPGLAQVAPHWVSAHPVEVATWFTQPHGDLSGPDGTSISPRAWLLSGGSPSVVAELAGEFDDHG